MTATNRVRPTRISKLHGEFRLAVPSGALTAVAAGTTTTGHVFSLRNPDATKKLQLRYLAVDFCLTTAFTAAQNMGFDAIVARSYTVAHTGGTAIDLGSTLPNSGKLRTNQATSAITAGLARIGGAGALTAGTHTLDANPFAQAQKFMSAVGVQLSAVLFDARDDGGGSLVRSPLELAQNEGIVLRNTVLMGATGVGTLIVTAEWDEITS